MSSNAVTFDTHAFIKRLKDAGVSEAQAEAHSEALRSVQDSLEIVTRQDLDVRLAELEIRLVKWMLALLAGQGALIITILKLFPTH